MIESLCHSLMITYLIDNAFLAFNKNLGTMTSYHCEIRLKFMSNFFDIYDLRVEIIAIEGRSVCGLAVGDYFELTESSKLRIPSDKHFCIYALSAVLPLLAAKQRELNENDWLSKDSLVVCPDPDERVIMQIKRVKKRTMNSDDLT